MMNLIGYNTMGTTNSRGSAALLLGGGGEDGRGQGEIVQGNGTPIHHNNYM